jgi:hypothetical protein
MKLYDCKKGQKFILSDDDVRIPPSANLPDFSKKYILLNIDGMYGNCKDLDGNDYYFAAWTEVNIKESEK